MPSLAHWLFWFSAVLCCECRCGQLTAAGQYGRALKDSQCCSPLLFWRVSPSQSSAGISWFAYIWFCSVFAFKQACHHHPTPSPSKKREGGTGCTLGQYTDSVIHRFIASPPAIPSQTPKRTWKLLSACSPFFVFRIPLARLYIATGIFCIFHPLLSVAWLWL